MFFKKPTGLDATNRLFFLLDLNVNNLYVENDSENEQTTLPNDVRFSQLRSCSFCRAERVANDRLYRLDEFKAVLDQFLDKKGFKDYKELRKEIIKSKGVEIEEEPKKVLDKKERLRVNQKSASLMSNI